MATETTTLLVNRPPNITWHRLRMNDVLVELAQWPIAQAVVEVPSVLNTIVAPSGESSFESEYWETGMGHGAQQWLERNAGQHFALDIPAGRHLEDPVVVKLSAQRHANAVVVLDVIAQADSKAHVVVHTSSENAGEGTVGLFVRIAAQDRASLTLTTLQTLDDGWKYLENIGILESDDASVSVRQTVLGSEESYIGLGSNQIGSRSSLDVDVRYLGTGERAIDFNYAMRMRGVQGTCTFAANGVLADASSKTMRDTIDLVHGCKGSVGNENETVLLVNHDVRNKSIPVILCDEDDVQGNHGATIGHVNPAQLEYMLTRGLTVEQIENLFTSAMYDYAVQHAVTEEAAAAVRALAAKRPGVACEGE